MTDGPVQPEAMRVGIGLDILALAEWVVTAGLEQMAPEAVLAGVCERLNRAGFDIGRSQVAFPILHPLFGAMQITWHEESGAVCELSQPGRVQNEDFLRSPIAAMLSEQLPMLRQDLRDPAVLERFPLLASLAGRGFVDYLAFIVAFGRAQIELEARSGTGLMLSFATRRPEGFSSHEIETLRWLSSPLALVFKVDINQQIAWNTLRTFHGSVVGARILGGTIRRGAGERLRTVIWYSDLRSSTSLAERLELDTFLHLLNAYFDCSAGAVLAEGGQVLELIGDAVLGIFPVENEVTDAGACAASLAAARGARARLQALARTEPEIAGAIEFGIGLHIGDLIFGNVGTEDRLSFGLVGGAVSEAARIETLTKAIGRPVLISDPVAAAVRMPLEDMGLHTLRGVTAPRQLWSLQGL